MTKTTVLTVTDQDFELYLLGAIENVLRDQGTVFDQDDKPEVMNGS